MPDRPWDPGLQPERTTLAWVRTGLAISVVSLLLTRLTSGSGASALAATFGGLVLAAGVVSVQAGRHRRYETRLHSGTLRPAWRAAAALTAATVAMGAVALVLVATRTA